MDLKPFHACHRPDINHEVQLLFKEKQGLDSDLARQTYRGTLQRDLPCVEWLGKE